MRYIFSTFYRNVKGGLHVSGNKSKKPRDRQLSKKINEIPKFKVGDLVVLRNHKKTK